MYEQFNIVHNRRNTSSVKWDWADDIFNSKDLLPMWVADMDFQAPKEVIDAVSSAAQSGIYGYTGVPHTTKTSIKQWLSTRHNWNIDHDSILFSTGVVPAIASTILALTKPHEKVLVQSPVYYPFFNMITKNSRELINSPLTYDENQMKMNFNHIEQCFREGVKLFLLCNPHNPGGRVWTKEELTILGNLCVKYNVYILSDEIHSDIVFLPNTHTPIASLSKEVSNLVVTCIAPSKTFNLAGLQAAAVISENKIILDKLNSIQESQGFFTLNMFGIIAMEAAYTYGQNWLDNLLVYLEDNIDFSINFIKSYIPSLQLTKPESTYLLWINYNNLGISNTEVAKLLIEKGKLALEPGEKFGVGGEGYVRMNIGCPRQTLEKGLQRLKKALT
jgi:cysteine-S-conjugate beta-lyase